MLIDRYPKIHRFGHTFKTRDIKVSETLKTKKHLNARVMFLCWPILIILILLVLLALYFHSMCLSRSAPSTGDYLANFLFPIIYFLLPSLIERITTGVAILAVRDDFNDYESHKKKRDFLTRRFSPETINEIKKSWHYPLYMLVDSIPKFVALLMSPICYYMCRDAWWLAIVSVIFYLVWGFASELICRSQ